MNELPPLTLAAEFEKSNAEQRQLLKSRAAIEAHEARKVPDGLICGIVRSVAELEYTSIEGSPDVMQVTAYELTAILAEHLQSLASAPPAPQASVVQEPVQEPLTDEQIKRFGETIGVKVKGWKDYESWGLGYRVDEDGSYTIPNVPDILVPFARAIEAAHGITKEQP